MDVRDRWNGTDWDFLDSGLRRNDGLRAWLLRWGGQVPEEDAPVAFVIGPREQFEDD